jgi:hypothetical protein
MKQITLTPRRQVLALWPMAAGLFIYTASRIFIRYPGTPISEAISVALPLILVSVVVLGLILYLEIKSRK